MPGFDDRLRRELEGAAVPGDPAGVVEGVARKRARRRVVRRAQAGVLAVAVLAGTAGGAYALARVFGVGRHPAQLTGPSDGLIAFVSDRDGNDEIYVMNADGSDQRRLDERSSRRHRTGLVARRDAHRVPQRS